MDRPSLSYLIDDDYTVLSFNQAAGEAFSQLEVGKKCHECLYGFDSPCLPCPVKNHLMGPHHFFDSVRKMSESVDAVSMTLPDGTNAHALVIAVDNDEVVVDEIDQLTGFLNRSGLQRFCSLYQPAAPDEIIATFALNLEGIDEVAFSRGEETARDLVRKVAADLTSSGCTLAYSGAGLFLGVAEHKAYEALDIDAILQSIDRYIRVLGVHLKAGLYRGSLLDGPLSALLNYAEAALNSLSGKKGTAVKKVSHDSYMAMMNERESVSEILLALENDEFDIYIQPKCHIPTGAIAGAEALARWIKPDGSVVSPGAFVPVLEKAGLISLLDQVIWEKTFAFVGNWVARGNEPVPVSVNVSRIDIAEMDVAQAFDELAKRYGVPDGVVEAEITETVYTEDEGLVLSTEKELQKKGFRVLIDDFGSGYSSLAMLKDVDADILKLDMGFLDYDEADESRATEIVRSVLEMAHQLDMYVIVEGVETEGQVRMLRDLGCLYAQGYFFYHPMPKSKFEELLKGSAEIMVPTWSHARHKSNVQCVAEYFWRLAEVNLSTGAYRFIRNVPEPACIATPRPATMEEYAERYIEHGYIHPDDVDRYRAANILANLKADIERGVQRERQAFRFLGESGWQWFVLEMVLPEDYTEDEPFVLFTWKAAADDIALREDISSLARTMYSRMYRVDLSTMEYECGWEDLDIDRTVPVADQGLFKLAESMVSLEAIHPADIETLLSFVNVAEIRSNILNGAKELSFVYRTKRDDAWIPRIVEIARSVEYSDSSPIVVVTLRDAKVTPTE